MHTLTLDTNCIINLLDFNSATPSSVDSLSEIIRYALQGDVNVAITTRVEHDFASDKNTARREEMLRKIRMFPVIGTIARLDVSRLDSGDVLVGDEQAALIDSVKGILFPGLTQQDSRLKNKLADVDHLVGHKINARDVFVTDDAQLLRRSQQLLGVGIRVMSPDDCLGFLDKESKKEVLVNEVLERVRQLKNLFAVARGTSDARAQRQYTELRDWMLRRMPRIQDDLLSFYHQINSVPVGGQRVFDQFLLVAMQHLPQRIAALYKDADLGAQIRRLPHGDEDSFVTRPQSDMLNEKFDWLIDLLTSYAGFLENR